MNEKMPRTPFSIPLSGSAKETKLRLRNIIQWRKRRPPLPFFILMAAVCVLCGNLVSCQMAEAEGPEAEVWMDYFDGEEMPWDKIAATQLEEYPGVTFRWTSDQVTASDETSETTLIDGMPVWNVFLCDLNGDGKREFCATVSWGSGVVDNHIEIYDYAARQLYLLWDRMEYDYALSLEDGQLRVSCWDYQGGPPSQGEPISTGGLALSSDSAQEGEWFIAQPAPEEPPPDSSSSSQTSAQDEPDSAAAFLAFDSNQDGILQIGEFPVPTLDMFLGAVTLREPPVDTDISYQNVYRAMAQKAVGDIIELEPNDPMLVLPAMDVLGWYEDEDAHDNYVVMLYRYLYYDIGLKPEQLPDLDVSQVRSGAMANLALITMGKDGQLIELQETLDGADNRERIRGFCGPLKGLAQKLVADEPLSIAEQPYFLIMPQQKELLSCYLHYIQFQFEVQQGG